LESRGGCVIKRSTLARRIFSCGFVLVAWLAAAKPRPIATPLPSVARQEMWQVIAADLRARGLAERQLPRLDDLELATDLPSLAGRSLRLTSACWDERPQRTQFRLECSEAGACLPFMVYWHPEANDLANTEFASRFELCRPVAAGGKPVAESRLRPPAPPKPTVRVGDKATAIFLADHLRMSASVTCLDRGSEGDVIRVRSQNGQIFRARVTGPALLEALE
jgi:hypothetical protein